MLNRNIHIVNESVALCHKVYKLVRYLVGVAIKKPYPRNIRAIKYSANEFRELIFTVDIKTVAARVLSYEVKLLYTKRLKILCLFYNIFYATASELSTNKWYGAICTKIITALGYLKVGCVIGGCKDTLTA